MNLRHVTLTLAALVLPTALAVQGHASVLVSYLDNDITTSTDSVAPNQEDTALVDATNLVITGYSGGTNDRGTSGGFDDLYIKSSLVADSAINVTQYLTFTITAQTAINLTSLTFDLGARYAANTTPNSYTTNYVVHSSTDSFTSSSERGTGSATVAETDGGGIGSAVYPTQANIALNDTVAAGNSIEFRIYFFDNANNQNIGTRINDLVLNGAAVPEPASLALMGIGGLMMTFRGRAGRTA